MTVADTRRALEIAEGQHGFSCATKGKIKGYYLVGTLSEYALRGINYFENEGITRDAGFFALFYPAFFKRLENTSQADDVFYKIAEERSEPAEANGIYYANGSMLIYVDDYKLLGEKVIIRLEGDTSVQRWGKDHNKTALHTWEVIEEFPKKKWQLVPTTCDILTPKLVDSIGLGAHIGVETDVTGDPGIIQKQRTLYFKDTGDSGVACAYRPSEWVLGVPVSSVNSYVSVDHDSCVKVKWRNKSLVKLRCQKEPEILEEMDRGIASYERVFCRYIEGVKQGAKDTVRIDKHHSVSYVANTIIKRYVSFMLNNWNTRIGEGSMRGAWHILSLFDCLYELGFDEVYKDVKSILDANVRDPDGRRACYECLAGKKIRQEIGLYLYAGLIIAEVYTPGLVKGLHRNYIGVKEEHGLSAKVWFLLLVSNPYALAMFGPGLRYRDCVNLESVLCTDLHWDGVQLNKEECKRMLYTLTVYKNYTRDSWYRDTLVSLGELYNKDVRAQVDQDETVQNTLASQIWKSGGLLHFGTEVPEIPDSFKKDGLVLNMPNLALGRCKIPYQTRREPFGELLEKLGVNGTGMMYKVVTKGGRCLYMPTYEARMEVSFMRWLYGVNVDCKPLGEGITKTLAKGFPFDLNREQVAAGRLAGYRAGVVTGDILHSDDPIGNKLDTTINFLVYVLKHTYNQGVVLVGDDYIETIDDVSYCHKPPYTEPTYVYSDLKSTPLFEEPVSYILEDINTYTLWDLYTFLSALKDTDRVFFMGNLNKKLPNKGLALIDIMASVLPCVNIGIAMDCVNEMNNGKYGVGHYLALFSYGTTEYSAMLDDVCSREAHGDAPIGEAILKIVTEETKNGLTDDDFGLIVAGDILNFDHIFRGRGPLVFDINNTSYYQGDRLVYEGKTDTELPRYELNEEQGQYIRVSTRGLSKHHEVRLEGVSPWGSLNFEPGNAVNKPENMYALCVSFIDSILHKRIYMFFDCKLVRGCLYGYAPAVFKRAGAYRISMLPTRQRPIQIIVLPEGATVSRQEVYSAIAMASRRVYFVGSVTGPESALSKCREISEPCRGRTLFRDLGLINSEV